MKHYSTPELELINALVDDLLTLAGSPPNGDFGIGDQSGDDSL